MNKFNTKDRGDPKSAGLVTIAAFATIVNPALLVQNKMCMMCVVYDRMLNEVKRSIILASPERILLDFERAAINGFTSAFPNATVTRCYIHLTQIIMRKVNEIGMKADYEKNDILRLALRSLPTLATIPSSDVTEVFR